MQGKNKKVVRTVAAAAIASTMLLVAACGSSPSSSEKAPGSTQKVSLTFAGWVPGIEDAVKVWNKKNPNIQVQFKRISSDAQKNYSTQIQAGTAGDILQVADDNLVDLVIDEHVQDIAKYVAKEENKFTQAPWASAKFGKGIYGIPQDSTPTALMYRKDIFTEYDIQIPKTWDDYLTAARKLHKANPDVYIAAFTPNDCNFFISDFLQEGGSWYATQGDTWKVTFDSKASQTVAERYQTLLDEDLVKVKEMWTPEFWSDVNNGTIASFNFQAWFPVLLEENAPQLEGKWAIAQSPSTSGQGPWSDSGGGLNVVTTTCKYPEQASRFITWLNTDPESLDILIGKGGLFPAAKAGFESSAIKKKSSYWSDQVVADKFIEAAKNVKHGMGGPLENTGHALLQDEFGKVANKTETFSKALSATSNGLKRR